MIDRRNFFKKFSDNVTDTALEDTEQAEATVSFPFHTVPEAGSPRQYRPGMLVLVENVRAWLGCDEVGFFAVDAYCPHLGCLVRPEVGGFFCPGHGSLFNSGGSPREGPAAYGLRYLEVDLDEDGKLVVRRDKTVSPDDRFIA